MKKLQFAMINKSKYNQNFVLLKLEKETFIYKTDNAHIYNFVLQFERIKSQLCVHFHSFEAVKLLISKNNSIK